ncbi:MAG: hypothetical protein K0S07_534 [Chlamydiales bacterium]|jgi:hypothetical protein|nr:hypothetical protein [Chlamydiales bacterium]
MRHFHQDLLARLFLEYWGVMLFLLITYALYERADASFRSEYTTLYEILSTFQEEKREALELQESYRLQIASQQDPQFLERVLIEKVGLSFVGYTKVCFQEE